MTLKKRTELKLWPFILLSIMLCASALAANDPGHDTLYIETQGNSELNGSLNTTGMLWSRGQLAVQDYLDILANGTTIAAPSRNTIAGTNTMLAIDANGDLYLNRYKASGVVYVGLTAGPVALNVSGALYAQSSLKVGGQNVCLANGTNCPASLGGANVSSIATRPGPLSVNQATGDVIINITVPTCSGTDKLTYNGNAFSCAADQTGAGGDGNNYTSGISYAGNTLTLTRSGMADLTAAIPSNAITLDAQYNLTNKVGLQNSHSHALQNLTGSDSNQCSATDKVTNVSIVNGDLTIQCGADQTGVGSADGTGGWTNNTQNTTTTLKVGIGTTSPQYNLHIYNNVSSPATAALLIENPNTINPIAQVRLKTGRNSGDEWVLANAGNSEGEFGISYNGGTAPFIISTTGNVGIGLPSGGVMPNQKLQVNGSVNISGSSSLYVPQICLDGDCRTVWPTVGGDGTGGWTNTSTYTQTNLNVNITVGNLTLGSGTKVFEVYALSGNTVINTSGAAMLNQVSINSSHVNQALMVGGNANITGIIYTPQICLAGVCSATWTVDTNDTGSLAVERARIDNLNLTKLNIIDQRYNDSAAIASKGTSNLTLTQVVDGVGNWTLDKPSYATTASTRNLLHIEGAWLSVA